MVTMEVGKAGLYLLTRARRGYLGRNWPSSLITTLSDRIRAAFTYYTGCSRRKPPKSSSVQLADR